MTKAVGGILGSLLALLVASILLLTGQGEACSEDWWDCAPGDSPDRTAQIVGLIVLIFGPVAGYRLGARVGPLIDVPTGIGIVAGTVPGWVLLGLGWWIPYAAAVMLVGGAFVGWLVERRLMSNR